MGVNELCAQCRRLVSEAWTLVDDAAPVDEELRDGKSYWILEDVGDPVPDGPDQQPRANGGANGVANGANGVNGTNTDISSEQGSIEPDVFRPFIHHSLAELASNPDINCHLCRWIVDSLPEDIGKYSAEDRDQIFAIPFLGDESIIDPSTKTLAFFYFHDGGESNESLFAVFLYMRPLQGNQTVITDSVIRQMPTQNGTKSVPKIDLTNPVRRQTVTAVSNWCKDCSANHDKCKALPAQLWDSEIAGLPTRLIGVFEQKGKPVIRLCESKDLPHHVKYATLSHCWGDEEKLRLQLLQENLAQLKVAIEPVFLPRTFIDALRFALELGITYLWMDALCIIQDSDDDWAFESTRMAWVYSQSYVNIAATASQGDEDSLFCQKDHLLANSLVLETDWPGAPLSSTRWLCFDETRWHRYIEDAPLNRRAWTFQERLLAPRTVHFAQDQVWWTCKSVQGCESLPQVLPNTSTRGPVDYLGRMPWTSIVEKYTASTLTFPYDKLAAISGLAQAYRLLKKYKAKSYVAGLWEPDFQMQLLWQGKGESSNIKDNIAPSWSWASVDGAVEWDTQAMSKNRIWFAWGLRASLDSKFDDPYTPVVRASIRADCMLYSVTIEAANVYRSNVKHNYAHLRSNSYDPRHPKPSANNSTPSGLNGLVDFYPNDSRFFEKTPQLHAYFLPLCVIDTNHLDDGGHPVVSGLLIEPVVGMLGTYKRLGKLDISYYNSPHVWVLYRNWMVGDELEPELYQKSHGGKRYDIVLI